MSRLRKVKAALVYSCQAVKAMEVMQGLIMAVQACRMCSGIAYAESVS